MADTENGPGRAVGAGDLLGGRYLVGRRLGGGGMAEVHEATDRVLGRAVAIKVLHPHLRADAAVTGRFEREARAAAGLAHPNVVVVHDVGDDGGLGWMVMELVDGGTLAGVTSGPRPSPAFVRSVILDVLGGLGAAHAAGLLHRDIKPSNVLLTRSGRAKVADFGIAKALDADDVDLTGTGDVIGSGPYLAPERAAGGPATTASDLWAVGVVLHELVTGRRPFGTLTPAALALAAGNGTLRPTDPGPGADPHLLAVARRALATDAAQRYPSAAAMAVAVAGAGARVQPGRMPPMTTVVAAPLEATSDMAPTVLAPTSLAPTSLAPTSLAPTAAGTVPGGASSPAGAVPAQEATAVLGARVGEGDRSRRRPWAIALVLAAVVAAAVGVSTLGGPSAHRRAPGTTGGTPPSSAARAVTSTTVGAPTTSTLPVVASTAPTTTPTITTPAVTTPQVTTPRVTTPRVPTPSAPTGPPGHGGGPPGHGHGGGHGHG